MKKCVWVEERGGTRIALTSAKLWHRDRLTPGERSRGLCRSSSRLRARISPRRTGCWDPDRGERVSEVNVNDLWQPSPVRAPTPTQPMSLLYAWHSPSARGKVQKCPLCMRRGRWLPSVDRLSPPRHRPPCFEHMKTTWKYISIYEITGWQDFVRKRSLPSQFPSYRNRMFAWTTRSC